METESNSQREEALISSFCEIASGSKEEARFFLESHNWDLDAAVSTFLDDAAVAEAPAGDQPIIPPPSRSPSPEYAPSRSRSPSPAAPSRRRAYDLRSRREKPSGSRIRTLADLNRPADDDSDSDADEPQEYYTGGEKRYDCYTLSVFENPHWNPTETLKNMKWISDHGYFFTDY